MMKIRLKILERLDMRSMSIKNIEWKLSNLYKDLLTTSKTFESLKLRNFGLKKPRNQDTKNQKPRNMFYFQGRDSPAPLNI